MPRTILPVVTVLLGVSIALGAQYAPAPVTTLSLPPDARFPEGIAYSPSRDSFFTANAETGAVFEINRKGDSARVVVPEGVLAPAGTQTFPVALGMKVDAANRLWIAGGRTGRMFVVDVDSGKVLKQVTAPSGAGSLINDVALVDGAAYFTDTRTPTLWRLAAMGNRIGDLEAWTTFADTPIEYDGGNNLNGIAVTPDGAALVVVQMDKGLLFLIDLASKAIRKIDTTGIALSGGDGLVMVGDLIYVVRQPAGEIVTLKVQPDPPVAKLVNRFRDPALAWPATALLAEKSLMVVNSQFNTRVTKSASTPFTFAVVPLSRLAGPVTPQ
jgi:Cu-Zn family superoxide dismutase